MTRYAKAIVPLVAFLLAGLKVLSDALGDGVVSPQEWVTVAVAALATVLVYAVPNTTTNPAVATRESVKLVGKHARPDGA